MSAPEDLQDQEDSVQEGQGLQRQEETLKEEDQAAAGDYD